MGTAQPIAHSSEMVVHGPAREAAAQSRAPCRPQAIRLFRSRLETIPLQTALLLAMALNSPLSGVGRAQQAI
jgi:hypothetical protein